MKYRIQVDVSLATEQNYNPLRLQETSDIELASLSDAAMILVKLHEFFEAIKKSKSPYVKI
jgi:hypothetical protein